MEEQTKSVDAADIASVPASEPAEALAALAAERDQLAREKAELSDRLLRRTADLENFRRRVERERLEFAEYANMETVRALLPVVDDLERALKAAESSELAESEFVKGVHLIYQRLMDVLKRAGLEPIVTAGQTFDPYIHHAVEMVQDEALDDHTLLDEYQRGYNFKGRLLRPAMVKVSVKPA
ncbi:MAG: nucleotide exchange factor GrpE [Acidobacteria bacterium]|nr:nucleotide exchange factor GrpE [Acidobacteriota bacterium]MBI3280583.1 nucleotide exchange factor GrpE [Acidobacteriota bacterium]